MTEADQEILQVDLDWPTPDDLDLEVYRKNADGSLTEVGSSGNFVGEKEKATINAPTPGTYVLRVINFASVTTDVHPDGRALQRHGADDGPARRGLDPDLREERPGPADRAGRHRARATGQASTSRSARAAGVDDRDAGVPPVKDWRAGRQLSALAQQSRRPC